MELTRYLRLIVSQSNSFVQVWQVKAQDDGLSCKHNDLSRRTEIDTFEISAWKFVLRLSYKATCCCAQLNFFTSGDLRAAVKRARRGIKLHPLIL